MEDINRQPLRRIVLDYLKIAAIVTPLVVAIIILWMNSSYTSKKDFLLLESEVEIVDRKSELLGQSLEYEIRLVNEKLDAIHRDIRALGDE